MGYIERVGCEDRYRKTKGNVSVVVRCGLRREVGVVDSEVGVALSKASTVGPTETTRTGSG